MARRQRDRVYESEDALIGPVSWYASVQGAQFHVDAFLRSKWWRTRSKVTHVEILYPLKTTGAYRIDDTHWRIEFSPRALCDLNVAHELTHVLMGVTQGQTPDDHDQDHSAHYAGAELEVVKHFLNADIARRLQDSFDENGAKYAEAPGPPPG